MNRIYVVVSYRHYFAYTVSSVAQSAKKKQKDLKTVLAKSWKGLKMALFENACKPFADLLNKKYIWTWESKRMII